MRTIIVFCISILLVGCSNDENAGNTNNNIPPSPPNLVAPSNGSVIQTFDSIETELFFQWAQANDPDNDVVAYRLWIDSNPNFTNPSFGGATETNRIFYLGTNQEYYWKVQAIDGNNNWSLDSQVWSFYIQDINAPTSPNLIFPINETECANDNLTFQWNASTNPSGGNINYRLHISESPSFDSNVDIYNTTNTSYNLGLPQGTALYWKVEAINDNSNSSFSEIRSLYTRGVGVNNTMPHIEYEFPNNEEVISGASVSLVWNARDNETSESNLRYDVYFSKLGEELQLIAENISYSNYPVSYLVSGTTYQWSVWVRDEDGATNVGDIYTFTRE